MGFRVKELHDGSRVPLVCNRFSDAQGDLFNELLSMPNVSMIEGTVMVVCPTFMSHLSMTFCKTRATHVIDT